MRDGKDEDDLIAQELGKPSAESLTGDPNEKCASAWLLTWLRRPSMHKLATKRRYKDQLKARIKQV